MATNRELERLARSLIAQRTDREFVVHYLMETYQVSLNDARAIVERVSPTGGRFKQMNRFVTPMPGGSAEGSKRSSFY